MPDLLLEIGVEEVPAAEVPDISLRIETGICEHFRQAGLNFSAVERAATNRRFMYYLRDLPEKAEDRREQVSGPPRSIAYDENGAATVALRKFLELNQAAPEDLVEIETPKGSYVGLQKTIPGGRTPDIIREVLPAVLGSLSFNQSMLWNESRVPFIRPLKNLLVLYDNQLVEVEFAGIASSIKIYGHQLLSRGGLKVNNSRDYFELLSRHFVMLKEEDRRNKILSEITAVEEEFEVKVALDEGTMNSLVYGNEYPVVFWGRFDQEFLELPQEITTVFMIREKKLLPVFSADGSMRNIFVGVANIPDESGLVAAGYERVLRAVFEDARFFWQTDLQDDFQGLRQALKSVLFQRDLGSYYDKTERLPAILAVLTRECGRGEFLPDLRQAAMYCKNDLLTRMVREFPHLQGVVGGLYLREKKVSEVIWRAVYGHYLPRGYHDREMGSLAAGLLSIADRLDSIAALLSKKIKISGSKDPYGLRRDANAVIRIAIHFDLFFDLEPLLLAAAEPFAAEGGPREELLQSMRELFTAREETVFKEFCEFRYDLVNAVLKTTGLRFNQAHRKLSALARIIGSEPADQLVALQKRIKNIIRNHENYPFSENLLAAAEERLLFDVLQGSRERIMEAVIAHDYLEACSRLLELKPVVDEFFARIMVMAEQEDLRRNRLALLQKINELIESIADFSLIIDNQTGGEQ